MNYSLYPKLEEDTIGLTAQSRSWVSVPQSSNSWKKAVQNKLPSYLLNKNEMRVVRF